MAISWTDDFHRTTVTINMPSPLGTVYATGATINFTIPTVQIKATSSPYLGTPYQFGLGQYYTSGPGWTDGGTGLVLKYGSNYIFFVQGHSTNWVNPNTYSNISYSGSSAVSLNTATYFNSSNSTTRSIAFSLVALSDSEVNIAQNYYESNSRCINPSEKTLSTITVTLNAPPTYDLSTLSIDTPYIYTGLTTASVAVSNLSAKYGGSITDVTFTIGNTSVSRSDDGTLSILLDTVGTFTPTVTVTDSRGQTTTKTLDPITVNGYVAPAVSFSADRTLASGVPDDEGGYATVDATFTYTDVVASMVAPSVVLTDENGTQNTPVVTWYSSRASDGTLSSTISDWSNVARGDTVYGLIPNVNTQYSYQISIRPRDTEGTGTAISQTLSSAFYTVDFLAGGHGIAFGQSASREGFFCNMDAYFVDANSVMRALFDFIHPVGSYYETSDTSFNPNTTWGGTWILEAEGQVHVSAGTNYAVSGALTDTTDGGEKTHTLTLNEMPSHNHNSRSLVGTFGIRRFGTSAPGTDVGIGGFASGIVSDAATTWSGSHSLIGVSSKSVTNPAYDRHTVNATHTHDAQGGGGAHNNMPPYIVVNRWHRTA